MQYNDFINWLNDYLSEEQHFVTIGGQSHFHAIMENRWMLFTSSTERRHRLKRVDFRRVFNRYVNAGQQNRHKASYYTRDIWGHPPNLTTPPWMAAIIRYYEENIL